MNDVRKALIGWLVVFVLAMSAMPVVAQVPGSEGWPAGQPQLTVIPYGSDIPANRTSTSISIQLETVNEQVLKVLLEYDVVVLNQRIPCITEKVGQFPTLQELIVLARTNTLQTENWNNYLDCGNGYYNYDKGTGSLYSEVSQVFIERINKIYEEYQLPTVVVPNPTASPQLGEGGPGRENQIPNESPFPSRENSAESAEENKGAPDSPSYSAMTISDDGANASGEYSRSSHGSTDSVSNLKINSGNGPTQTLKPIITTPAPVATTAVATQTMGGSGGDSFPYPAVFIAFGAIGLGLYFLWPTIRRRLNLGQRARSGEPRRQFPVATAPFAARQPGADSGDDFKTVEITEGGVLRYSFATVHHQGKREYQEDSFGFSDVTNAELVAKRGVLAVVADGMGGLKNGKSCSERTVNFFRKWFPSLNPAGSVPAQLRNVTLEINREIYATDHQKGGTTLVAVCLVQGLLYWVSVGDSAIYLFRRGRIYQLNREHHRLNDLYLNFMYGEITKDDILSARSVHGLTSNIGREEMRAIDQNIVPFRIEAGDRILLCSDGISGRLSESELTFALSASSAPAIADIIRKQVLAKNAPKQDNFTAEIICCD